jgi:hypothetical protein
MASWLGKAGEGIKFEKQELLECPLYSVPANPDALLAGIEG